MLRDELANELDVCNPQIASAVTEDRVRHAATVTRAVWNASSFCGPSESSAQRHRPPHRRGGNLRRISVPQQQMQLMRIQPAGGPIAAGRPPGEAPARKAFLRQPKSLTVIDQQLERPPAAIAEHDQSPAHRIGSQGLTTQPGQTVDAFAEIHWLDRQQQAHLGCDLDHGWRLQNASAKATRTAASPAHCTVIFPPWASHSSTVQEAVPLAVAKLFHGISTNPGGDDEGSPGIERRRNL